ncbi:hypothetical protein ILUMI_09649 [Ignelater luminosus]|uniref:Uncharacterized protein n=1 Tax=Ignelater luminosus TaxID=2038154 RepID=A0A8K0D3T3_IGNLU|nr:hypothetical protein ILUMI_09649 [Ignelater luminosus]
MEESINILYPVPPEVSRKRKRKKKNKPQRARAAASREAATDITADSPSPVPPQSARLESRPASAASLRSYAEVVQQHVRARLLSCSPSQRLMSRKSKTLLYLIPKTIDPEEVIKFLKKKQIEQKQYADTEKSSHAEFSSGEQVLRRKERHYWIEAEKKFVIFKIQTQDTNDQPVQEKVLPSEFATTTDVEGSPVCPSRWNTAG